MTLVESFASFFLALLIVVSVVALVIAVVSLAITVGRAIGWLADVISGEDRR